MVGYSLIPILQGSSLLSSGHEEPKKRAGNKATPRHPYLPPPGAPARKPDANPAEGGNLLSPWSPFARGDPRAGGKQVPRKLRFAKWIDSPDLAPPLVEAVQGLLLHPIISAKLKMVVNKAEHRRDLPSEFLDPIRRGCRLGEVALLTEALQPLQRPHSDARGLGFAYPVSQSDLEILRSKN